MKRRLQAAAETWYIALLAWQDRPAHVETVDVVALRDRLALALSKAESDLCAEIRRGLDAERRRAEKKETAT